MGVKTLLKKYDPKKENERDTSLRGQALDRVKKLKRPSAGTPFDWEDWERLSSKDPERERR